MPQILVFGDSITYGAWDREGGWVARLRKFLDEKTLTEPNFYYLVYNLGVSGDTTLEDGQHPNSAGHQKFFEIVKEFLIENKII